LRTVVIVVESAMTRLKRWIIVAHRWLGAGLSLFALMWFASGIVLLYAPLPAFRAELQPARLPLLDCSRCRGTLREAIAAMPGRDTTAPIRLGMLLGRPVWRYLGDDRRWHLFAADLGTPIDSVDGADAVRIATADAGTASAPIADSSTISGPDQWTLEDVLRNQLPLHRIEFGDRAGTQVYVSERGGEVILTTTRRERALAWMGAIPHFLYPRILRSRLGAWLNVVIILAGLGALASLSGLINGIWLLRLRGRATGTDRRSISPYRTGWMRWHHYLGLIFGVFTFTWMLSGMLSVDPFEWSPGDGPTARETLAFAGGALDATRFTLAPAGAARILGDSLRLRELRPLMVAGRPYWLGIDSASSTRIVRADTATPAVGTDFARAILDLAISAASTARILDRVEMRSSDDYYYPSYGRPRNFPVVRVRLADAEATALYVDPALGEIVMKEVTRSRAERWLYTGLHDLDFRGLGTHRPLWDIMVIGLLLGGLSLAVTSVVGAWRWLAPKAGIAAGPRR
jgi:hypothetical protein